jgi:transposase
MPVMGCSQKDTALKKTVVAEVEQGKSFRQASKDHHMPLSTVVHWCEQKNIKSKHTRANTKATDEAILDTVKKHLLLSAKEIGDLFGYKENAVCRRLNRLAKQKKLLFIVLSGRGKGKIFFTGYIDKRLYYMKQEDLDKWIRGRLPKDLPGAIKRSISQKLHESGIPFEFKKNTKRVVVVDDPLFKEITKKAHKQGISTSEYVRRKLI